MNPLGIDETAPRLSWIVTSDQRADRQTAYRILVASSEDRLKQGVGDLWDTGEVATDATLNIAYAGKPLTAGQRAWWSVEVKDKDGKASSWSAPAYWEKGLDIGDWKGDWIGRNDPPDIAATVTGGKWIWYPEGTPGKEEPRGDRLFTTTLHLDDEPKSAQFGVAVDDSCLVLVNGKQIGGARGWSGFADLDPTPELHRGDNQIVITAHNGAGPAGLLLVGAVRLANGQTVSLVTDRNWTASIGTAEPKPAMELPENSYGLPAWLHGARPAVLLSKSIDITKKVVRARVYASAKGLYRLTIDGKRVGQDDLTPGWTDYRKRIQYQTYDVTSALKQGGNALEMALGDGWYCGHVGLAGRENYGSKPLGLLQLEIEYSDGSKDTIVTDGSWKAGSGPIVDDDLLMGEDYDARIQPGGWSAPDVQPLGDVPLLGQHSPTVQVLQELKPIKITEPEPGHFVYDLGQNMVG
ncbi:MAG TPA: alpha-L-rhamnosidase N-terminal domain-containing protein, partial [Fimbriimonadaceae bacterium]|nr:alpha-L-rhamnosidase N-terminal domain-containing protein [Fimbriimonadaceae bacterium]